MVNPTPRTGGKSKPQTRSARIKKIKKFVKSVQSVVNNQLEPMSNYVIKVENLSKSYLINHQSNERYTALRDVLTNNVKHLGQQLLRMIR